MAYLVTGGCGFIGSHLAEALVSRGEDVRVFDNLSSGYERNLAGFRDRVDLRIGDVRDRAALDSAMQGVTHVFHEAALVSVFDSVDRPGENHEINITGTLNVLLAARERGVRRVVVASSAAIYGDDPALPKSETMLPAPESPYGLAKIAKEYYMRVFARLYGVETVSLRYFNVYGPRQDPSSMYSGVISKFTDTVRGGEDPTIYGDGKQTRDFVFVRDVVQANLLAMQAAGMGAGEAVNVGTGIRTSLLDLLEALRELTGATFRVNFADARKGDIRHSVADISLAGELLGYRPGCGIREGLGELLAASARDGGR